MQTLVAEQHDFQRPEYLRLPSPDARCALTGLSRTTLCELSVPSKVNGFKPPVKSLVVKKRGAMRGIRLINYDSLLDYLHHLEAQNGDST
jgi:hypothetical protein